jgi:hypothetical protein
MKPSFSHILRPSESICTGWVWFFFEHRGLGGV